MREKSGNFEVDDKWQPCRGPLDLEKNNSLILKIGKTGLEELNSLFNLKIIQKQGKLHLRTIKIIFSFVSRTTCIHQDLSQT